VVSDGETMTIFRLRPGLMTALFGGRVTAWTDPNAGDVVYIPTFQHPDVAGVTFGGFVVQQYAASQPNATDSDDNPDVADGAAVGAVPAHSKPMVSPWREITMLNARKTCANIGVGWHLITAYEWSSLAMYAHMMSTQPHGSNANTNPPSDASYPAETGVLDAALFARNATYKSALTGSGPNTWAHNHSADGVFDLNGVIWQWNEGLMLCPASLNDNSDTPVAITGAGGAGYPLILANLAVALTTAPYGASTSVAAHTLTDTNKVWTANAFVGSYLFDAAGALYVITANSATALTINKAAGPAAGPYSILRLVATNITAGITSGHKILTLQSGADLAPFAVPATADVTGAAAYGNDFYYHGVTALSAALRGGGWDNGVGAGVFALGLDSAPSHRTVDRGARACKAL
jgi:hypothetical protein